MIHQKAAIALSVVLFIWAAAAAPSFGGDFSIMEESTVIGRNYGYPTGTPATGRTEVGSLDLVAETTIYVKNLELVHVGIDGETFIGFLTPLRLRYRPHEQLTFEPGVFLAYDFGDAEEFDQVEPILRLVYEPAENLYLVGGSIIRTHSIHDALLDDTSAFKENVEQGFQFRVDQENFKEDLWINWRIKETSMKSERFDFANVSQLRMGPLRLDGQLYWRHTGGQKNTEDLVENNINYLLGGSFGLVRDVPVPLFHVIEEIRIGGYYIGSRDDPDNESGLPETDGSGFEGRIVCDLKPSETAAIRVFGSYFQGEDILNRAGDPVYAMDDYTQIGFDALLDLPDGLKLEIGAVAQFIDGEFVHTEHLYLSWGKGFPLLKGL